MTDEIKVHDAGTADKVKLAAAIVIVVAGVAGYYVLASQPAWMRWLPVVGSGTGPLTVAPVRFAVSTISRAELSIRRWSNAFKRIRMFWFAIRLASRAIALHAPTAHA